MRQPLALLLASLATAGGLAVLVAAIGNPGIPPAWRGLGALSLTLGVVVIAMVAGGPMSAPAPERL